MTYQCPACLGGAQRWGLTYVVERARPLLPRVAFDYAVRAHHHFTFSNLIPRPARKL